MEKFKFRYFIYVCNVCKVILLRKKYVYNVKKNIYIIYRGPRDSCATVVF